MISPNPPAGPRWILHVNPDLNYCANLEFSSPNGPNFSLRLTPAFTSVVLALIVSREIDERRGRGFEIGYRKPEEIGRLMRQMPGRNHGISAAAVGCTKRAIIDLVRDAFKEARAELNPVQQEGSAAPEPILNPGHGYGYCLAPEGIELKGINMDDLVRPPARPTPPTPPQGS